MSKQLLNNFQTAKLCDPKQLEAEVKIGVAYKKTCKCYLSGAEFDMTKILRASDILGLFQETFVEWAATSEKRVDCCTRLMCDN